MRISLGSPTTSHKDDPSQIGPGSQRAPRLAGAALCCKGGVYECVHLRRLIVRSLGIVRGRLKPEKQGEHQARLQNHRESRLPTGMCRSRGRCSTARSRAATTLRVIPICCRSWLRTTAVESVHEIDGVVSTVIVQPCWQPVPFSNAFAAGKFCAVEVFGS